MSHGIILSPSFDYLLIPTISPGTSFVL